MISRSFRAFLDRFEGDTAILLLGDEEKVSASVPKAFLPPQAAEGSVLRVTIRYDAEESASSEEQIGKLIDELSHGNE